MGVNSLPKTVTRQRRGCDLNPGKMCKSVRSFTHMHKTHIQQPTQPSPAHWRVSATQSGCRRRRTLSADDFCDMLRAGHCHTLGHVGSAPRRPPACVHAAARRDSARPRATRRCLRRRRVETQAAQGRREAAARVRTAGGGGCGCGCKRLVAGQIGGDQHRRRRGRRRAVGAPAGNNHDAVVQRSWLLLL